MPSQFAKTTSVPVRRSRDEIESTLKRYGVTTIATLENPQGTAVAFEHKNRRYRLSVPNLPVKPYMSDAKRDQATRQRWRVLLLLVKAKLEMIEVGLSSFEDEFLPQTILPGSNRTVGDVLPAQIEQYYAQGSSPQLLLEGPKHE